ncbi:MAG: phage tail P2-like protein [Rickettsiales bacterium]|jgi:phage tail P2-like protein
MTNDNQNNQTLLPLNVSELLKDLEKSSLSATNLETLNRYVTNPNQAPEHILPWLAFAVSVDDWSDNWADDIKRNVIKASVEIHKKKGTIGALRSALEAFDYENITVEEWFDYDAAPHFFRVLFSITKEGFDVDGMPEVIQVILNTKNARSYLDDLKAVLLSKMSKSNVGAVIISKEVAPLYHFIYQDDDEIETNADISYLASAVFTKESSIIATGVYDSYQDRLDLVSQNPYFSAICVTNEVVEIRTLEPVILF